MEIWLYVIIGTVSGLVMGTAGVGGGALVIFLLLEVAHFDQRYAQGTTLLVVAAPVSLLAAYQYHRSGLVNVRAGLIIMASFLVASYLGSLLAAQLPRESLKYGLGVLMVLMGLRILTS